VTLQVGYRRKGWGYGGGALGKTWWWVVHLLLLVGRGRLEEYRKKGREDAKVFSNQKSRTSQEAMAEDEDSLISLVRQQDCRLW